MELNNLVKELRNMLSRYDNSDIREELAWAEETSNKLAELVLRYDLEQEHEQLPTS